MKSFSEIKSWELIQKFAKGSSVLSLEKVIRIIFGLLVHSWVVRSIGAERFGHITYVYGLVVIFQTFSIFGLDEITMKRFVHSKNDEQTFQDVMSIRLRFAFFSFLMLVIFASVYHFDNKLIFYMIFIYALSLFPKAFITFENYLLTHERYSALFWSRLSSTIIINGIKIIGVYIDASLNFFMMIYLLEEIVQRLINYFFMRGNIDFKKIKFFVPMDRALFLQAIPIFLYSLLLILDQKLLVLVLEYFNKMSDLGIYSVSFGLYEYTALFPLILSSVLFPSVVRAHSSSPVLYEKRKQYLSDIMVILGLLVAIFFSLFAEFIVHILFGSSYMEAAGYLRVLGFLCPMVFFNLARLRWFIIEDLMVEWMLLSLTCLLLNIALQFYLVPQYGVYGGIASAYISMFIGNLLCSLLFNKIRNSAVIFVKSLFFWLRIKYIYRDLKKEI